MNTESRELIKGHKQIFQYVTTKLEQGNRDRCGGGLYPFRKRSDHTLRVYQWAKLLMQKNKSESLENESQSNKVDSEAVLVAALFHDIGYSVVPEDQKKHHAAYSAELAHAYLIDHNYPPDFTELVVFLVSQHSKKSYLLDDGVIPELVILLEADLLDETGAMSIAWDCMMEGALPNQSFEQTLNHIERYTQTQIAHNPMRSTVARRIWDEKIALVKNFVEQFKQDLFL